MTSPALRRSRGVTRSYVLIWRSSTLRRAGLNAAQKRMLAAELNIARRHLTPDQKQQLAIDLRERNGDYWTLVKVGELLDVSYQTIRRWAADSTFTNVKVDEPTRVVGKDGKSYPTTYKPRAQSRPTPRTGCADPTWTSGEPSRSCSGTRSGRSGVIVRSADGAEFPSRLCRAFVGIHFVGLHLITVMRWSSHAPSPATARP